MITCGYCDGWGLVYKPMNEAVNLIKCKECFGIGKILQLEPYELDSGFKNLATYSGRGGKSSCLCEQKASPSSHGTSPKGERANSAKVTK